MKLREGYNDNDNEKKDFEKFLGLSIGLLVFLIVLIVVIETWAIVVLVKHWNYLPTWARIISILGVIPGVPLGPVVTLIVVYVAKSSSPVKN